MDEFILLSDFDYERADLISPNTLAYIGDAVFELYIRAKLISQGIRNPGKLHGTAIEYVKASEQRKALEKIKPFLSEKEEKMALRGRNAGRGSIPKNTDPGDYSLATAFETLIGYLYLNKDSERLKQILKKAVEELDNGK